MKIAIKVFSFFLFTVILLCACSKGTKTEHSITTDTTTNSVDTTLTENNEILEIKNDTLSFDLSKEETLEYIKGLDDWDKYSEGIIPSIIEQHLPYAQKLINNKYDHFIIVDKNTMMVILYDKFGRRALNFKMACGKNYGHKQKKADSRTPEGYFLCGGRYDSTDWLFTDDNGYTSPVRGQFGPRFIRVCPQIGIHGTGARYSIGRRCSHGCIRIQNEQILYLYNYAQKGMPIIVNPGEKDIKANKKAGIDMPALVLPDSIIDDPEDFINYKNEYFKEKAQQDSIRRENAKKAASQALDSAKIADSISKQNSSQDSIVSTNTTDTIK